MVRIKDRIKKIFLPITKVTNKSVIFLSVTTQDLRKMNRTETTIKCTSLRIFLFFIISCLRVFKIGIYIISSFFILIFGCLPTVWKICQFLRVIRSGSYKNSSNKKHNSYLQQKWNVLYSTLVAVEMFWYNEEASSLHFHWKILSR